MVEIDFWKIDSLNVPQSNFIFVTELTFLRVWYIFDVIDTVFLLFPLITIFVDCLQQDL